MKALIADDDVFVRKCLLTMLPWQELGFDQVLEAPDGSSALKIALNTAPDLLISDVKMPGISGLQLAEKLRASMVDVFIIILSEYSDFEFVQKALKIDAQDYILKPITKERLAEIAEKIREMAARTEMRKNYFALRNDAGAMRDMIAEMLDTGDTRACMATFEDTALNRIRIEDFKPFCVAFLRELYAQAGAMTHKKQELEAASSAALSAYSDMKNIADVLFLVREQCEKCVQLCARRTARTVDYARLIDEYIEAHYSEQDLSVSTISEKLRLSAVYTGTLYKQHKGTSIVSRINEVRLRHAEALLRDTNENVRAISQRVGYVTPDYFSRLFSSVHGLSPSQYRAMMLQGPNEERASDAISDERGQ
ncbi:MAG: response regulator [Clostridia bacterium]|nr:response regulator [Clostridia bacterium]